MLYELSSKGQHKKVFKTSLERLGWTEEWNGKKDDKYYVNLKEFKDIINNAIPASKMKDIRGKGYSFMMTMYSIDDETCKKLEKEINKRV